MSNLEAAQSGDYLRALKQLRDTLAEQLDTTTASIHAQLSAQFRATLAEIDEIAQRDEGEADASGDPTEDEAWEPG